MSSAGPEQMPAGYESESYKAKLQHNWEVLIQGPSRCPISSREAEEVKVVYPMGSEEGL